MCSAAAIALNVFVIRSLSALDAQSRELKKKIEERNKAVVLVKKVSALSEAEVSIEKVREPPAAEASGSENSFEKFEKGNGSQASALSWSYLGRLLSKIAIAFNFLLVVLSLVDNHRAEKSKLISSPLLSTALIINNIANLLGFILLGILGARNAGLIIKNHDEETDKKIKDKDEEFRGIIRGEAGAGAGAGAGAAREAEAIRGR
jgi:hypothetical protein